MNKGKVKTSVMWILTVLIAVMIMLAGYSKFGDSFGWAERFVNWGYAPWFASVIGGVEIVGGIALLIPQTALISAMGLTLVMLGAIVTHLMNGEAGSVVAPLVYLVVFSAIIFLRRQKALNS